MSVKQAPKTNRPYHPRPNDVVRKDRIQSKLENKILSICQLYKDGHSLRKIAAIHRVSHESIRQILINHKIYYQYEQKSPAIGQKKIDKQGYVHVFVGVDHLGAARTGWMLEHRLVMAQHIGRPLQFWEIVHHRDRDKQNNEVSNLEVTNSAEHSTCLRCPYYDFFKKTTGLDKIA